MIKLGVIEKQGFPTKYALKKNIASITEGKIKIILNAFISKGLVEKTEAGSNTFYSLTARGKGFEFI